MGKTDVFAWFSTKGKKKERKIHQVPSSTIDNKNDKVSLKWIIQKLQKSGSFRSKAYIRTYTLDTQNT